MKKTIRFKTPHNRSELDHPQNSSGFKFFLVLTENPHIILNGGEKNFWCTIWTKSDIIRTSGDSLKARSFFKTYKC